MNTTAETVPAIDFHSHFIPPGYRKWLVQSGKMSTDGVALPSWSLSQQIEDMDRSNIRAAILSLSSPDIHWGDSGRASALARHANEIAADAVAAGAGRLGFFATLPMPDVEASLAELEYAYDVLHADGVKLLSNSNGVYLGDPTLDPVFAELGRRGAVVAVHPVRSKAVPDNVLSGVPCPVLEFPFDTTRALANIILNGTLLRNPDVKLVCPHMGALFPLLAGRMARLTFDFRTAPEGLGPLDVKAELARFYYDTAGGFDLPVQIPALKSIAMPQRVLYGSDYPFTPSIVGVQMLGDLRNTDLLTDEEKVSVLHSNALRLFPRFISS